MVDARTIEDLAMSLVEERRPEVYRKILPVYSRIKEIVERECALEDRGVGYGNIYFSDINLDSLDARNLALELEKPFNKDLPDEAADNLHTIYDTVLYFLGRIEGGYKYKVVAESSYRQVCQIKDRILKEVNACFVGKKEAIKLDIPLIGYDGLDMEKLLTVLELSFVHDKVQAEQFSRRTLYDIIEYVAKRDIEL